jgi:hypothetical protein
MIDPLTAAAVGAGLHSAGRLAAAHAEAKTLRARAELARAVVDLSAGTEISGTSRGGTGWLIRVPVAPITTTRDGDGV